MLRPCKIVSGEEKTKEGFQALCQISIRSVPKNISMLLSLLAQPTSFKHMHDLDGSDCSEISVRGQQSVRDLLLSHPWICCADSDGSDSEPDRDHGNDRGAAASAAAAQDAPAAAVAAPSTAPAGEAAQRDDWMSESNARRLFSDNAQAAEETNEEKQAARAERMKVRYCNLGENTITALAERSAKYDSESCSALASTATGARGLFRGSFTTML